MKLGTQFPAAIHILLKISNFPDTRVTNEMLAKDTNLSAIEIRKLIRKLKAGNILDFKNGTGKFVLAKPPSEITLWDIFNVVEHENFDYLKEYLLNLPNYIENEKNVIIKNVDSTLQAIKQELEKKNLQNIKDELN